MPGDGAPIVLAAGASTFVATSKNGTFVGKTRIGDVKVISACISVESETGRILVGTISLSKEVCVYRSERGQQEDLGAFKLVAKHLLPKRLSSVSFVGRQDPTEIIVSDSVGDVFTFPLSESCDATVEAEHEKRLMLAHFSLVTDCLVQGKLVASCDRDNRIRISRFPRSYVIEAFLLGHSDLVTCLAWVSDSLLLSGSADGSVCLWDVTTGECEPCSRLQLGDGEGEHRPMVISVDGWLSDGNFVVVVLENDPKLRVVRVASEGNNVEVAHEYAPPDCSGHITGALFDDAERLCVTSANYDGVGIYTFSASEEGNVTMDLCNTVVCSTAEKADDDSCDMGHLRPFWLTQLRRKSIDENWKGKKRKAASSL